MKRLVLISLFIVLQPAQAQQEARSSAMRVGWAEFERAFASWNGPGFGRASERFGAAVEQEPGSAEAHYWKAVALFHQMLEQRGRPGAQPKDGTAAMDQAIAALEEALARDASHAESHALLGTLYGMKVQGGMLRAIRYGRRIQLHQHMALRHGAKNPRVIYLYGAALYHTAKQRGDYARALATLKQAEQLFQAERRKPRSKVEAVRWGHSSCLTFIGLTHRQLGNKQQALAAFRRALAIHPADRVAKEQIATMLSR